MAIKDDFDGLSAAEKERVATLAAIQSRWDIALKQIPLSAPSPLSDEPPLNRVAGDDEA